jgi:hypothetical protein
MAGSRTLALKNAASFGMRRAHGPGSWFLTHCDRGSGPLSAARAVSRAAVRIKKGVCREAGAPTTFER